MTRKYTMKREMSGEEGVSSLIEYIMISGVLVTLFIIMMLTINSFLIEQPVNMVLDRSFVDIGNGVSTRMVEVYIIAPQLSQETKQSNQNGYLTTNFDIPDEVVGRDYLISVSNSGEGKDSLIISRGSIEKKISLAGIGASLSISGNTTSRGTNQISYNQ